MKVDKGATLAALIGLPPRTELELTTPLSGPSVRLPPLSELLAAAEAHRAELRELAASGTELDAELILLRREVIPNPTLILELERDLPGPFFVGAGLAFPLPTWRSNQGKRLYLVEVARYGPQGVSGYRRYEDQAEPVMSGHGYQVERVLSPHSTSGFPFGPDMVKVAYFDSPDGVDRMHHDPAHRHIENELYRAAVQQSIWVTGHVHPSTLSLGP